MADKIEDEFLKLVNALAEEKSADFFLFSHTLFEKQSDLFLSVVRNFTPKRENAALVLCTDGGSPDSAFQMARKLKSSYKKLTLYVFGKCKSAGTLIALAADEIVMSEFGQFGPLDIQLSGKDEVYGQTPALDVKQALTTIAKLNADNFLECFYKLQPGRIVSTKTAAAVAEALALGLSGPIAHQIDPILIGRVDRSMQIAEAYINRLHPGFDETKKKNIISGYPSHSFVIDFLEAKSIFSSVRCPDAKELQMEDGLRGFGRVPFQSNLIRAISEPNKPNKPNESPTKPNDTGLPPGPDGG
jgi:hypothetical protein